MAYTRGDYHLWSDGKRLHVWAKDGYDGWDERWENDGRIQDGQYTGASGVSIPENIADAFAVMRFAELLEKGILDSVIDHVAASHQGRNFGGDALRKHAEAIKAALEPLIE